MIAHDAAMIAGDVNNGSLDTVDVVNASDAVIAARNDELNALVGYDGEPARAQAREVARRVRSGEVLPLAGVPIVVKDNVFVADRWISQGSRLFAEFIPPCDAIAVERVKAADAIIIGIGNCPEFAGKRQTNSPLHGIARHPINRGLTPGGSSVGNAAAIAAGFAPIGLGRDGGGSGRRPLAHTGTVGFKPSFGAIPYGPGFPEPFLGIATIASMGRTVRDVALLFSAVVGPDYRDPDSIRIERDDGPRPLSALRIAYSPRLGLDVPVDADVQRAVNAGCGLMRRPVAN